jgi:hypothetical protein
MYQSGVRCGDRMDKERLLLGSHFLQLFCSVSNMVISYLLGFQGGTGQQREQPSTLHQVMRNKIPSTILLNECRY